MGQLNTSKVREGNITRVNPITWICPFPLQRPMFVRPANVAIVSIYCEDSTNQTRILILALFVDWSGETHNGRAI